MQQETTPSQWGRVAATSRSPAQYRATRHKKEAQRTRANALILFAADSRVRYKGADPAVAALAAGLGFERHDLVIVRVALSRVTVTAIIAPRRVWHRAAPRKNLLTLKRRARNMGCRVVLVPEPHLRKEPRLQNSTMIVSAADTAMRLVQRLRVEMHVLCSREDVTLDDCASVLSDHEDPDKAVLAVVNAGRLRLRLDIPIDGSSRVWVEGAGS